MNLLILNPNTTPEVTRMIKDAAAGVHAPGTEVTVLTAEWGLPYIATRAEAVIAGHVMIEMLAKHHQDYDAAIIAAFGDPGLGGARELFDIPVLGLSEAAMLTACMLGRRFSVITFSPALRPWYGECVEWHGLQGRCASIRALDEPFSSVRDVQADKEEKLVELARLAVEEDGADVVIPAGTPLAGLARKIRDRFDVPVVDLVASSVKQAERWWRSATASRLPAPSSVPGPRIRQGLRRISRHASPASSSGRGSWETLDESGGKGGDRKERRLFSSRA